MGRRQRWEEVYMSQYPHFKWQKVDRCSQGGNQKWTSLAVDSQVTRWDLLSLGPLSPSFPLPVPTAIPVLSTKRIESLSLIVNSSWANLGLESTSDSISYSWGWEKMGDTQAKGDQVTNVDSGVKWKNTKNVIEHLTVHTSVASW